MPPLRRTYATAGFLAPPAGRNVRARIARSNSGIARLRAAADYRRGPGPSTGFSNGQLPDRMVVKLPYYNANVLTALTTQDYVYSLGSVFDPDVTGGGRQPRDLDQWAGFYSKYRVLAVNVKSTFSPALAVGATVANFDVALVPTTGAVTSRFVNSDVPFELPRATRKSCSEFGGPVTINKTYYPWVILGVTKEAYLADDKYAAAFSADPAVVALIHTYIQDTNGLADTCAVSTLLTYTVQLEARVLTGTS